jgi:hypothetical protein
MNLSKLVFLCGHRKCGTTLLNNLLDNHEQLIVYPTDLTVLYAYYPYYTENNYTSDEKKDRLNKVIFENLKSTETVSNKIDLVKFKDLFFEKIKEDFSIKSVIEALFLTFCKIVDYDHGDIVVGKETSIEIYAREIYEMFPNCKFIHIIRDPRDNYASLYSGLKKWYSNMGDTGNTLLHSLLERYGLGLKMIPFNQKSIGSDNYMTIRFEDLVLDTENMLKEICSFINISYDKSMLNPTILGEPTGGNSFENRFFTKVDNENVNNWKNRIDDFPAKVIEFHFKEYLINFDYNIAFPDTDTASAAIEFYKWSNYYYHYKERF